MMGIACRCILAVCILSLAMINRPGLLQRAILSPVPVSTEARTYSSSLVLNPLNFVWDALPSPNGRVHIDPNSLKLLFVSVAGQRTGSGFRACILLCVVWLSALLVYGLFVPHATALKCSAACFLPTLTGNNANTTSPGTAALPLQAEMQRWSLQASSMPLPAGFLKLFIQIICTVKNIQEQHLVINLL